MTHTGAEVLLQVNRYSAGQAISGLLGLFAALRKATISFVMSVRQHRTTRFPLDGFYEILHLRVVRKSVEKIQDLLKPDKIKG
jgi:hypothetical protein